MPAQSDQPDALSFEDAMDRLDTIVASMEGERMPLEEMVSSYELGARLLKSCRQRIENARKRVDLITADLDGTGKASLSDFDADAAEADAPAPAKARATSTPRRTSNAKPASEDADDIRLF
jgi:exodeoxyribonuclease VII small subunit